MLLMFPWCANSEGARKGHLCVFSCVSAARRCVWTSSHRTSSCKQKVAPLNASAGVLAGAMSFHILSHSPQCGRCAASSSPCWILWETQVRAVRVVICYISYVYKDHQSGLLTSLLTLYSWGKCTPLCAASCPPGPTDHPHPPAWREGGTDHLCSGWSRCSAASLQSLALPLSEYLKLMCTLISRQALVNFPKSLHSESCFIIVCDWQHGSKFQK